MDKEIVITGVIVIILGLIGIIYGFSSYITILRFETLATTISGQPSEQSVMLLEFYKNQIIAIMIIAISTIVAGAGIISAGKK